MNFKPIDFVTRADFPDVEDWTKWDEIVERTKREIQELLEKYKGKISKPHSPTATAKKTIYLYTIDGEQAGTSTLSELVNKFQVSPTTVSRYSKYNWIISNCLLSQVELNKDNASSLYRNAIEHGHVYSLDRQKKPIYCYNEFGNLVSVFTSYSELHKQKKVQRHYIVNEKLYKCILYSYNKYNEVEAKGKYLDALPKPKEKPIKPVVIKEKPIKSVEIEKKKPPKEKKKKVTVNPVYMFNNAGELIDKSINPQQLANRYNWNYSSIYVNSERENVYKGFLLTRKLYEQDRAKELYLFKTTPKEKPVKEKKIKPKTPKEKPIKEKPIKEKKPYIQLHPIYQYNKDGEMVATYPNAGVMAKQTGWKHNTIKAYCKKGSVYNGFLITHTCYDPQQAKERFVEALNRQQMTYIYKGGELVAMFSTLAQVREYINSEETLKKISYYKEIHKPIGDYILSNRPLDI